jgi:hypothetical protein
MRKLFFLNGIIIWALAMVAGVFIPTCLAHSESKVIVGWVEKVLVLPDNIVVLAKIDTGADHSSLNVQNIKPFRHFEKEWVQFTLETRDGRTYTLEKPVFRYARIKRKKAEPLKRPVVLFDLCVGSILKKNVEVNLANRQGFKYNMLIGRSFLKGSTLVDSEMTYTQSPSCQNE